MDSRQLILIKSTLLILFWTLSVLWQGHFIGLSNSLAALLITVFFVWGVPGLLITNALLRKPAIPLIDKLTLSFVIGIEAFVLLSAAHVYTRSTMQGLNWSFLIVNSSLILSYLIYYARQYKSASGNTDRHVDASERSQLDLETKVLIGIFVVIVLLFMYVFATNLHPWLIGGDRWTYTPYIRVYLDSGEFQPFKGIGQPSADGRLSAHAWMASLAFISQFANVELVEMYNVYLPVVLGLTSLLSFYVFHRALFKESKLVFFSSIIYVLYLGSTMTLDSNGFATRGGHRLMNGVVEDKGVTLFIFLPIAMTFMFWFLDRSKKRYLFLFALAVGASAVTHPIAYVFICMFIGLFALVRVSSQCLVQPVPQAAPWPKKPRFQWSLGCKTTVIKFAILTITTIPFVIFPALQRMKVIETNPAFLDFSKDKYTFEQLAQVLLDRHVIMMDIGRYRAALSLIDQPTFILAIILTPVLLFYIRRDKAAQFLLATFLGPLAIVYIPLTASLLGNAIGAAQLYRVNWVVPAAQLVAYVLYQGVVYLNQKLHIDQRFSQWQIGAGLNVVLGLILVTIWLSPNIIDGVNHRKQQYEIWKLDPGYVQALQDLGTYVSTEFSDRRTVVAPYRVLRHLPALTMNTTNLFFAQGTFARVSVHESLTYLFQKKYLDAKGIEFLKKYNADYLVCDSYAGCAPELQIGLQTSMFRLIYHNEYFRLYKVVSLRPSHVISGNMLLQRGAWQEAIRQYEAALEDYPDEPAAYFGLGSAYYNLGQLDKSAEYYHQAFVLAPDNIIVRNYLIETYIALGKKYVDQQLFFEALTVYKNAIKQAPDNAQAYWNLAEMYQALGQTDKAITVYTQIITRWPEQAQAHFQLGQAYHTIENFEAAEAEYKETIRIQPAFDKAYIRLGRIYQIQNKSEDAISLYQTVSKKNSTAAWPHLELGKIYLKQIR